MTGLFERKMPPFSKSSYAGFTGWVISTFAGWFNFDP
jgi:hypothetical protein